MGLNFFSKAPSQQPYNNSLQALELKPHNTSSIQPRKSILNILPVELWGIILKNLILNFDIKQSNISTYNAVQLTSIAFHNILKTPAFNIFSLTAKMNVLISNLQQNLSTQLLSANSFQNSFELQSNYNAIINFIKDNNFDGKSNIYLAKPLNPHEVKYIRENIQAIKQTGNLGEPDLNALKIFSRFLDYKYEQNGLEKKGNRVPLPSIIF